MKLHKVLHVLHSKKICLTYYDTGQTYPKVAIKSNLLNKVWSTKHNADHNKIIISNAVHCITLVNTKCWHASLNL